MHFLIGFIIGVICIESSSIGLGLNDSFLKTISNLSLEFFAENNYPTLCIEGFLDDEGVEETASFLTHALIKPCYELSFHENRSVMLIKPISFLFNKMANIKVNASKSMDFVKNENITYLLDATQMHAKE